MNPTCQFTHDDGHVCGAPLPDDALAMVRRRRKYCRDCAPLAEAIRKRKSNIAYKQRMRDGVSTTHRSLSRAAVERRARIIAQYGAPGMGISPLGKVRTLRAVKL